MKNEKLSFSSDESKSHIVIEDDDKSLVLKTLANPEVFEKIMQRYSDKLRRYIFRISRSSSFEIDDLLQNIFIKIYKNLNNFDSSLSFSSWIYRIAHNETIDYLRKAKIRPRVASSDDEEDFFMNVPDDKINILEETNGRMLREQILKALLKIKEKYRTVLILKYMEDKNYNEISDILKIPLGTVAILLHRAKKEFKEIAINSNINKNDI